MTNNQSKNELDGNIMLRNTALSINNNAPLSNRYQIAATSDNTRRAYQTDIRHFETWGG